MTDEEKYANIGLKVYLSKKYNIDATDEYSESEGKYYIEIKNEWLDINFCFDDEIKMQSVLEDVKKHKLYEQIPDRQKNMFLTIASILIISGTSPELEQTIMDVMERQNDVLFNDEVFFFPYSTIDSLIYMFSEEESKYNDTVFPPSDPEIEWLRYDVVKNVTDADIFKDDELVQRWYGRMQYHKHFGWKPSLADMLRLRGLGVTTLPEWVYELP